MNEIELPYVARANLSEGEKRYLSLVAYGVPRREINRCLGVGGPVADEFWESICDRIGASTDHEAASYYWIDSDYEQPRKGEEVELYNCQRRCLECLLSGLMVPEIAIEMNIKRSSALSMVNTICARCVSRGARGGYAGTVAFIIAGVKRGDYPEWMS